MEDTECGGDIHGCHRRDRPDEQSTVEFSCGRHRLGDGTLGRVESGSGCGQEGRTGFGEFDSSAGSGEELDAEFVFERLDLMAERGLHDMRFRGRAGEVAFLGDGENIAQLLQFHSSIVTDDRWDENYVLDS